MSTRIRNFFKNNPGYKIAALLLASAMWLLVYNIEDPVRTTTYTIPVTITGSEVLDEMNKCYEVIGGSGQVTFAASAKRTTLEKISAVDFTATANMARMTVSDNGKTGTIPVEISAGRFSSSVNVSSRAKYLEISLEDLAVKQFVVTAMARGSVADGYALGSVVIDNPNIMKVSGPTSLVQSVDRVVAAIDVEGMSQNISDNVVPVLYDASGEEINNNRLMLSNTTVTVKAAILNTKQIPIRCCAEVTPEEGYYQGETKLSMDTVWVKGTASALNRTSELVIPAAILDVANASEEVVTTVDITEYLPEGVELLDKTKASVEVRIEIIKSSTKTFSLPVSAISVEGLASNERVQYNSSSVTVTVMGEMEDLAVLGLAQLKASIDVSGLEVGLHHVPLHLELGEMYSYIGVKVPVTIVAEEPESESEQE